jgi:branched-chain amino acid aminotransferase
VDRKAIADGRPGEVTRQLQTAYDGLVRGNNTRYQDWLTPVWPNRDAGS